MATKAQKKLDAAKRSASNRNRKARDMRADLIRRVTLTGTSYGVGKGSEFLQTLPTFFGLPRTATLGVIGGAVAMFAKGDIQSVGEGLLDAGLALTAFQLGTGQTVAGMSYRHAPYTGNAPIRDVVGASELEADIEEELAAVNGVPVLDDVVFY